MCQFSEEYVYNKNPPVAKLSKPIVASLACNPKTLLLQCQCAAFCFVWDRSIHVNLNGIIQMASPWNTFQHKCVVCWWNAQIWLFYLSHISLVYLSHISLALYLKISPIHFTQKSISIGLYSQQRVKFRIQFPWIDAKTTTVIFIHSSNTFHSIRSPCIFAYNSNNTRQSGGGSIQQTIDFAIKNSSGLEYCIGYVQIGSYYTHKMHTHKLCGFRTSFHIKHLPILHRTHQLWCG